MDSLISIKRKWFTNKSTVGKLYLNGQDEYYTLEDTVRKDGVKIHGKTAIPVGKYEAIINFSHRFQRPMPLLLNVPSFDGVRIHSGNTDKDTDGCILIGWEYDEKNNPDFIGKSRLAFSDFFEKLESILDTGKVFIDVH